MIFTRREPIAENSAALFSPISNRENPCQPHLLRELAPPFAPIPVTRLWTPRTPLKIRELKTQTFH
jgi:hypothetical protein